MANKNQVQNQQASSKADAAKRESVSITQQWAGPLPPPGALEEFNGIIPNGAERIMRMVEKEQDHRIGYEGTHLRAEIRANARGHWMGTGITVLAIVAASVGGYLGLHPAICIAIVGLPIATIIKSMFGKNGK